MFNRQSLMAGDSDWHRAVSLGLASQLAYHSTAGVRRVAVDQWGFEDCVVLRTDTASGFLAWDVDNVVLAFRGAPSVAEWLESLQLDAEPRSYGLVQRQFFLGFDSLRAQLESELARARTATKHLWTTGHGLGGALALVAATELALFSAVQLAGVYTFGQPKVFARVDARVEGLLSQHVLRFVADDDVVPALPPEYKHLGPAIVFDAYDQPLRVEAPWSEAHEEVPRQPSLFAREEMTFPEMQETVRDVRAAFDSEDALAQVEGVHAGDRRSDLDASIVGLVSGLGSHGIGAYLGKLRRCASDRVRVDHAVRELMETSYDTRGLEFDGPGESQQRAPVVLRVKSPDWQPPVGFDIESRLGVIVSGSASPSQLEALAADGGVLSIEWSREGGEPELASSLPFVGALDVHRPPVSERGDGTVVGIIDTGVDVLHQAFLDGAGQTRIRYLWNQRDSAGPSPHDVDPRFSPRTGRLYVGAEIQQMIQAGSAPPALRDPGCHGTHVASIAAGRQVGPFAGGMAPEAKLVVVIPNMVTTPPDPPSLGYSSSHQQALALIGEAAERLQLPVVVNVSLGMNAGSHDGSSTLEAAFDQFTDIGRKPGVVVVKSAGNERGYSGHARVDVSQGAVSTIAWSSEDTPAGRLPRDADYIEVWYSSYDDLQFVLKDPADPSNATAAVSTERPDVVAVLGGNRCQLQLTKDHKDNGDNLLCISISQMGKAPIQRGTWTLQILGRSVTTDGVVHVWVERDDRYRGVRFQTGDNDEMTLSIPGTAHHVITVGACEARLPICLTPSSSWGLTRDNRPKPDLCAPGSQIMAARANTGAPHHEVMAMTGTSMAAPHVTGAVALALSKRFKLGGAQLNARQIQKMLARSTKNFTGRHNRGVGFGTLDALAFFNGS